MPTSTVQTSTRLVDAHVHLYASFRLRRVLDGALANFRRAADRVGIRGAASPVVVLADRADTHHFRRLRDGPERVAPGWRVRRTEEDAAVVATRGADEEIVIIAGRQIATSDALEALALGVDAEFEDGRPLRDTLETMVRAEAVTVIPWGFGKWWFRRGALVREILAGPLGERIFIGDNGCRPRGLPRSSIFAEARKRGIWSLPGTDPLPFPREASRPGSFGFVLNGELGRPTPARDFRRLIHDLDDQPRPYGTPESMLRFGLHQTVLQVRKRVSGRADRRSTKDRGRERSAPAS